MFEGPPPIEAASTDEESKKQVQEGLKLSLEEQGDVQKAHMLQLQNQTKFKLTPEEFKARKEREERQKQRAA